MKQWRIKFYYAVARFLAKLRYQIEVIGLDQIQREKFPNKEGILFLPNHPSQTDPPVVALSLAPKFYPSPVVTDWVSKVPLVSKVLKDGGCITLPDFSGGYHHYQYRRAEESFEKVVENLKRGKDILIYPSGQLKRGEKEILGGASGIYKILQSCPKANVVLVRTRGLLGSSFSKAFDGKELFLLSTIKAFWMLVSNLIF